MRRILLIPLAAALLVGAAAAEAPRDRFWILWERTEYAGQNCPAGAGCIRKRNYTSRLFDQADISSMYRLFGMLDSTALSQGRLAEHPDAPRICQHNAAEVVLGFDPERLPKSEKLEVLRGLSGFTLDVRDMKAPPGHSSAFGSNLQKELEKRFRAAGLKVMPKSEAAALPGAPELNIYFANTGGNGRCDYNYSIFASLTQTVLLTRDLRIKVSAGVWSYSTGSASDKHRENEWEDLLSVADAFIDDYRRVN